MQPSGPVLLQLMVGITVTVYVGYFVGRFFMYIQYAELN